MNRSISLICLTAIGLALVWGAAIPQMAFSGQTHPFGVSNRLGGASQSNATQGESADPNAETAEGSVDSADPSSIESIDVSDDAEASEPAGLDEWIDQQFKPISDFWLGIVLLAIPIAENNVPLVVILLVLGATFFTLFFGFPNLRLFGFSIRVVSGRYDAVEKEGAAEIKKVEVHEVGGDIIDTIRDESEQSGEVSHFQALATAVSGTVGLGNIAGVAVAIATGGPGATFWMIVCGLLGMTTKFVECTLGVKYREITSEGIVHGGPMYYLKKGLADIGMQPVGIVLSGVFAVLCVGGSLGGGNAFQSNQATQQILTLFKIEHGAAGFIVGLIMAAIVAVVIIGGIKRIASVTEKIVPLMAIIYIVAALIIIFANISHVPRAFGEILQGAFAPKAAVGGLIGVLIVGFQRAAFSNEAGAGSAAIAHSAVKTRYPASEGVVALLEPFIDTVVICTMTALVIVIYNTEGVFSYGDIAGNKVLIDGQRIGGVDLTSFAFDSVLPGFRYILTVAIILFAFSTMISWSYYGLQAWKFLFGRGRAADLTYKLMFCAFVVIGASISLGSVIDFSDAMILAMVFPNMLGLFLLFPKVRAELIRYRKATRNFDNQSSA